MKIPLAVPNLLGRESEYLQECITSTFVSSVGPFVDRFEAAIAEVSGTPSAAVVCSGTVALQLALEALGCGRGDLVMIPSLTFIATPNAVSHCGATPWLVDCDAGSWAMDPVLCRQMIEQETTPHPRGRQHMPSGGILTAVMPVMIMGATLDFAAWRKLADDYGLKLVIDAAAAIGARAEGDLPIGAAGPDALCYSFNGNKTITSGGGGAVAAPDPALIARIRHLSSTGRTGPNYDHDVIAYNFRMTNVQAALGMAQIERLEHFLERKADIRQRYARLAERFNCLAPFPEPPMGRSTHWFSGFWYTGEDPAAPDAFRAHMNEAGVDLRPFWKPVHMQAPYLNAPASAMPVTNGLWDRIFPLPCSTHISEAELDQVISAAARFWEARDDRC